MADVSFNPVSTVKTNPESMDVSLVDETCPQYENLVKCTRKFVQSLRDKPGSCKKWAKAFPECYKKNPKTVELISNKLWDTFETQLVSSIQTNNIKLKSSLVRFSKLEEDDKPTWRPCGEPEKDIEAYVGLAKQKELKKLKEILKDEETENERLTNEITDKEKKLKTMFKDIEAKVNKWEEVSNMCKAKEKKLIAIEPDI